MVIRSFLIYLQRNTLRGWAVAAREDKELPIGPQLEVPSESFLGSPLFVLTS
jgi:hypothetical protein